MEKNNHNYYVGFSTEDISPPISLNVRLGGYIRLNKFAKKVIHPLKARAMCIKHPQHTQDPQQSIIMIACDLVGFQYTKGKIVRKIISKKTQVPISNIMLHFTHSHSSPDMIGIFPNKINQFPRTDVQYPVLKYIMKKMIKAGIQAFQNATEPAKIGYGESLPIEKAIATQRRPPYRKLTIPIRMLKITREQDDKILGVIVNYQGHPTQLPQINSDISTEYPGLVVKALYERIPELQFAAYYNGAIGDVTMSGYRGYGSALHKKVMEDYKVEIENAKDQKKKLQKLLRQAEHDNSYLEPALQAAYKDLERLGHKFADYIIPALNSISTDYITEVETQRKFLFPLIGRRKPVKPRLRVRHSLKAKLWLLWDELRNKLRIFGLTKGYYFMNGRHLAMLNIHKNGQQLYHQTELQIFKINDFIWFSSPGEPFLVYQEKLLAQVPSKKAFFTNMAETCGYIFPWAFNGYEEMFNIDVLFGEYLLNSFEEVLARFN